MQFSQVAAAGRDGELRRAASRRGRSHEVARAARRDARSSRMRTVPARLRVGHRSRTLAITGLIAGPDLNRVVDLSGEVRDAAARRACVLSKMLADVLGASAGRRASRSRCSRAARPVREVRGRAARRRQHGPAGLHGDRRAAPPDARGRHRSPARTCWSTRRAWTRSIARAEGDAGRRRRRAHARRRSQSFRGLMAENMNDHDRLQRALRRRSSPSASSTTPRASRSPSAAASWPACACSASRAARSRSILLGELALLTLARPAARACVIGYGLARLLMLAFENEVYRLPARRHAAERRLVGARR